jgi:hypothetical protein
MKQQEEGWRIHRIPPSVNIDLDLLRTLFKIWQEVNSYPRTRSYVAYLWSANSCSVRSSEVHIFHLENASDNIVLVC